MKRPVQPILIVLAALLSVTAGAAPEDVLTPERVADLRHVVDVALEASGERVAYVLAVPRGAKDGPGASLRELWVADVGTGSSKRLADGKEKVSAPAWTPDGKRIAFLSEPAGNKPAQVHTQRARGGDARPLTSHDAPVSAFRYSPDGQWLAFTSRDPKSAARTKAEKAGRDEIVHDPERRCRAGGERGERCRRLYLFDLKRKKSRVLTSDLDVITFEWTPDGSAIVFQATAAPSLDDDYMNRRLHVVGIEDGAVRALAPTPGKLGEMAVSPDGERLAFLGATSRNDPLAQSVFVLGLDGTDKPALLTEGYEASVSHVTWRSDGTLLLVTTEGERHVLDTVDPSSGVRQRLGTLPFIVDAWDARDGRLAFAGSTPAHPAEVFVLSGLSPDGAERLTRHADLGGVLLARQEVVEWPGPDSWRIRGVLTYPLDYEEGKRYPLVLQVHGGPEGVSLDGWTTTSTYPVQLLARDGFMVLEPNYRGSGGRGVAFSKADHDDLGGKEFEDVLAGIDALAERGLVDASRVGTGGWSYGGYFSAWAATRWSERFQASVVGAGITNWIAFTGTTDIPYEMSLVHWNSWWLDQPELHWQRSPLAHLQNARTPTLILHGAVDERVHPEQGLELYTALRVRGIPTRSVVYPREEHGLSERAHQVDAMERVLAWFGKYLVESSD